MEKKLSKPDIIKIIELYRENNILWDMSSPCYRRNDLKSKALDEIAKKMAMPVEQIKKRIKSLRSTYLAEKKKVDQSKRSGCNADSLYVPSLFWFSEMSFIDSSIVVRKPTDNIPKNSKNSNELDQSVVILDDEGVMPIGPTQSKIKKTSEKPQSKFDEAVDTLLNFGRGEDDVFKVFGEGVSIQLRELPADEAYPAMGDITNILIQRKLKSLKAKQTIHTHSSTSYKPSELTKRSTFTRSSTPYTDCTRSSSDGQNNTSDFVTIAIEEAEISFEDFLSN